MPLNEDSDSKPTVKVRDFEPYVVKGIVLEYYEGGNLFEIVHNVQWTAWKGIMDEAMEKLEVLDNTEVLNRDASPHNFLVFRDSQEEIQVLTIDFDSCELRESKEKDAQWGPAKCMYDEEGVIIHHMGKEFEKHNYEWSYVKRDKYTKYEVYV